MILRDELVKRCLERYPMARETWLAPAASLSIGSKTLSALGALGQVESLVPGAFDQVEGPAVLVLAPEDLCGPHRAELEALARRARPGRPVLLGGTGDRDTLLDAINRWHIFRVVPKRAPQSAIIASVEGAHDALHTVVALECAARELRRENRRIEENTRRLRNTQSQLLHSERLTTLGRLTGGLVEGIRHHLAALDHFQAAVSASDQDAEVQNLLGYSFEGIRSIASLLDEIHAYAERRKHAYDMAAHDLDSLVERVVALARFDKLARARAVEVEAASGARIRADRYRIYHVILNLLRNAFQATAAGDTVRVETSIDGEWALVVVEDTGCGMSEEVRKHIFEPFFTTKEEEGMGLGLRMAHLVIARHGGSIRCSSTPGVGTRFEVRLPLSTGAHGESRGAA